MPHGGRVRAVDHVRPVGTAWTARTSVAGARLRIYEVTRGPVPEGSHIESACGGSRCVNLDHLLIVSDNSVPAAAGHGTCHRGHELLRAALVPAVAAASRTAVALDYSSKSTAAKGADESTIKCAACLFTHRTEIDHQLANGLSRAGENGDGIAEVLLGTDRREDRHARGSG